MITTLLVEHPWLTTVTFLALVGLGPLVGTWLVARPRLGAWLGIAALVPIVGLTLVPTSRALEVGCAVEWSLPTFGAVELMANVVLFVPAVLLLAVASRRPIVVLLGASATSALIELVQAMAPALGRSCSTNDWVSNSLGAVLGAGLAAVALVLARRRTSGR